MREIRVIHYDPDAPESAAARAAVRAPLLVLAHARDRAFVDEDDVRLFNLEVNEVADHVQKDPELAVRFLMELLMALDRAVTFGAAVHGVSNESSAHRLIG